MTEPLGLNRRAVLARLLRERGDAALVTGLGSPTYDAFAAGDSDHNFYLWGGMGGAAMLGLGLALAQPKRRVVVWTGDGEMLMGLGALATIAVARPANLAIVVVDNEHYGETGMQPAHTGRGVDLTGIAAAAGFGDVSLVRTPEALEALAQRLCRPADGPLFACVKVSTEPVPKAVPSLDGPYLRTRFRLAMVGAAAFR
jgi:thiamine pyrophosphate-dependent acetolactate synthase large subunit-like protein